MNQCSQNPENSEWDLAELGAAVQERRAACRDWDYVGVRAWVLGLRVWGLDKTGSQFFQINCTIQLGGILTN